MRKRTFRAVCGTMGVFAAFAAGVLFAAAQTATGSPILTLAVNGGSGTSYAVGQSWTLDLASAAPDSSLTMCAVVNGGQQSCTPDWGTTDANGNWTSSGKFDSSVIGSWVEWVELPSGASSNEISFTVAAAAGSSPSATALLSINGSSGGSFSVGQPWILDLSTSPAVADTPFTICAVVNGGQQSCTPDWGTTDASGNWFQSENFGTSTVGSWNEWVQFPSGLTSNHVAFTITAPSSTPSSTPGILSTDLGTVYQEFTQELEDINAGLAAEKTGGNSGGTGASSFPATVLVTAWALNVRSGPSTANAITGSQTLYAGDTFTAVNEVVGQDVDGNDLWWVSSFGNYVWSGGTTSEGIPTGSSPSQPRSSSPTAPVITAIQGFNAATGVYSAGVVASNQYMVIYGTFAASGDTVFLNGQAVAASAIAYESANQINVALGDLTAGPATLTVTVGDSAGTSAGATVGVNGAVVSVTSGGVTYPVTYTYLPDGEVRASFTYNGSQMVEQNYAKYKTGGGVAKVESDGSFGLPYSGQADTTLQSLASQINTSGPPNESVYPGFVFSTELYYVTDASPYYADVPAGVYGLQQGPLSGMEGVYGTGGGLYSLVVNSTGNIIALKPYDLTLPGGYAYYAMEVGTGWLTASLTGVNQFQTTYSLLLPDLPSGIFLTLQGVSVSGAPSQVSAASMSLYSGGLPVASTSAITFSVGPLPAGVVPGPGNLKVVPFNHPQANGGPAALVLENGTVLDIVDAGGVAAYSYLINNGTSADQVLPLQGGWYEVAGANGAISAIYDENGNSQTSLSGLGSSSSSLNIIPTSPATVSASQLQSEIMSAYQNTQASISSVATMATQAGYRVYESSDGTSVVVRDPVTNAVVAAIDETNG